MAAYTQLPGTLPLARTLAGFISDTSSVLLSNSGYLKQELHELTGVPCVTDDAAHFNYATSDDQREAAVVEYFLLGLPRRIVAYSTYAWISNFVAFPAAAWCVPLEGHCLNRDAQGIDWFVDDNSDEVRRIAAQHNG